MTTWYSVDGQKLEDALTVGPTNEWTLFRNRDKFDLVAIYDDSTSSFGDPNAPLSILVRAIYEIAFRKMLKRMPMLIVGGLGAWKKDIGEDEVVRGEVNPVIPEFHKSTPVQNHSAGLSSTMSASPLPEPHQLWTPRTKLDSPVPSLHKGHPLNDDPSRQSLDPSFGSLQCV
jgi:ubiquitin carboxyl-terminal hydrolase 8